MPYYIIENLYVVGYDKSQGLYAMYNLKSNTNMVKLDNFNVYCPTTNIGVNIVYKLTSENDLNTHKISYHNGILTIYNRMIIFKLQPFNLNIESVNGKFYNLDNGTMVLCSTCKEFMKVYSDMKVAYCRYCKEGFRLNDSLEPTRKRVSPSYSLTGSIELTDEMKALKNSRFM